MGKMISVVIADDHLHEVTGFADLLAYADQVEVVGVANSISQAENLASTLKPDVIMLDMVWFMDATEGLKAIQRIKEVSPQTSILAMSAYPEKLQPAKQAGADVAISKDLLYTKQAIVERIMDAYQACNRPKTKPILLDKLTERELEVTNLMCDGLSDKDIGKKLFISCKTVKRHAQSIYRKLGVNKRTEVVSYVLKNGAHYIETI